MGGEAVHLRELVDVIGPRPATTDAEARAADYVQRVFEGRGLDVERQDFLCPRTSSWTYAVYHLLTIVSAVWAGPAMPAGLRWAALAVSLAAAYLMWRDLDTRTGLSAIVPKGPSQNIIARHVPKSRRGERVTKVVVVAHYDSARASLAFSPSMVKHLGTMLALTKGSTFLVPLLVLPALLPGVGLIQPWLWYATLAVAAYLLVPLFMAVHRETLMRPTDGGNDNGSGVAAMLGVMERTIPEPESAPEVFMTQPIVRTEEAAEEAEVVPDDAILAYAPASAPPAPEHGRAFPEDFSTDEFTWAEVRSEQARQPSQERLDLRDEPETPTKADESAGEERPGQQKAGVRDWLGLSGGFDPRREGRRIGSWDNFDEDEDEGWKGGSAEIDSYDDPEFAASEAARIRRKVTSQADRSLSEKEVWFVATGAKEPGAFGMQALLAEYGADLKGAVIVNIDTVGSGNLHWLTREGIGRRQHCDRRLASTAKRVVSEEGFAVRSREYRGIATDATPALARKYRAMTLMGFDINGRLPNLHWTSDTLENVDEKTVETAADFVAALIRAL